ncbi:MAG: forkhead-associated protein, partial [Chloroflexales bacterium]|nr:forkhead-associated protein [Chloroflexales bacterium]
PYARVAVASAELEPAQGWAWDAWLGALAANPGQDAAAIAGVIVDSYISSYQGSDDVTLVALDLAQVDQISAGLHRLASALLQAQPADYAAITQARTAVDAYEPHTDRERHAIDLGRFAQLLTTNGATGEVATAATAMGSAIQQARLAHGAGLDHRDDGGVSVYFPPTAAQYLSAYEHDSPLPGLTHWAEFLKAYHHSLVG